jgi:malic enzyme
VTASTRVPQGRRRCVFLDSKGVVCASRTGLQEHKRPFAHDIPFLPDLLSAVREFRPTALIGVSSVAGAFTPQVVAAMAEANERPIIFPLSNPTENAECTFRQVRPLGCAVSIGLMGADAWERACQVFPTVLSPLRGCERWRRATRCMQVILRARGFGGGL